VIQWTYWTDTEQNRTRGGKKVGCRSPKPNFIEIRSVVSKIRRAGDRTRPSHMHTSGK